MIRKPVLHNLGDEKLGVRGTTPVTDSDFSVRTEGDTFLLTPETARAESWVARHIATLPMIGRARVISSTAEFARIVNAIIDARLIVEERRRIDSKWRFARDQRHRVSSEPPSDDDESSDEWDCEVLLDKYRNSDS